MHLFLAQSLLYFTNVIFLPSNPWCEYFSHYAHSLLAWRKPATTFDVHLSPILHLKHQSNGVDLCSCKPRVFLYKQNDVYVLALRMQSILKVIYVLCTMLCIAYVPLYRGSIAADTSTSLHIWLFVESWTWNWTAWFRDFFAHHRNTNCVVTRMRLQRDTSTLMFV